MTDKLDVPGNAYLYILGPRYTTTEHASWPDKQATKTLL